jgi:hypothetical protein
MRHRRKKEDNVQAKNKNSEPETLRVHREMYERRLREMEVGCNLNDDSDVSGIHATPTGMHDDDPQRKAAVVGTD